MRSAASATPRLPTNQTVVRDPLIRSEQARALRAERLLAEYAPAICEQVHALRLDGYSTSSIAAMLNFAGVTGPTGQRWCASGVRRLLALMQVVRAQ